MKEPPNSILRLKNEGSSWLHVRCLVKSFVTLLNIYGDELLARRPTRQLQYYPFSAVRDCLFNTFVAATLHIWRPFLNPQPEDAPCCVDREPLVKIGTGGGIL